jgi:selenocysteine lyase/cysteine desulfurase
MSMTIDIAGLRAERPGTSDHTHLNNAGSGLMSATTLAAITDQLEREARLGQMEAGGNFDDARLYQAAAKLLGARPQEIAVVESHTRGFGAVLGRLTLAPGDRILVTRAEWIGNVTALSDIAAHHQATIEVMPVDDHGATDVQAVAAMLDARVKVICITWAPANGGLINPAAELVALGHTVGALTIVDAAQMVGQQPVNVTDLGCDVLTAPGRKFLCAPRGTGLLYVAEQAWGRLAPAVLDDWSAQSSNGVVTIRADARRFENPDMPPALKAGLMTAIEETLALGIDQIAARISFLAERMRAGLADIAGATCRDLGQVKSGLVSFTVEGRPAAEIRTGLAQRRIAVGMNGRGYTPYDMAARNLDEILRISPHVYTTEAEIDLALQAIDDLAIAGKRN